MKKNVRLPDRPSELIELALHDLALVEKQKSVFTIKMSTDWFTPNDNGAGKCAVCLAGAVLAQTVGMNPKKGFETLPPEIDRKTDALDCFRKGEVREGLRYLGRNPEWFDQYTRGITPYALNPAQFKKDMRALAKEFKAADL